MREYRKDVGEFGEVEEGKVVTMGVTMGVLVGVAILIWRRYYQEAEYRMGVMTWAWEDRGAWWWRGAR